MSEKATLLTSIPPVKKSESKESSGSLLTPSKPSANGKISLLDQTKDKKNAKSTQNDPKPSAFVDGAEVSLNSTASAVGDAVSTEVAQEQEATITSFQFVTYSSFVLSFLLAGAASVVLFKKASKLAEERFVLSTRALATACAIILLHGFVATFLYSSHLNNTLSSVPLFVTMGVWIFVGPIVGFIVRNLLARKEKPNRKAAVIDGIIYGVIFFLTACGVSDIKTNAALLASIIAGFLMIVPIARSLTAFRVARARHKELKETSDVILLYGLLILPALLPVLAFLHVCGLSDALTLFLINFITFDFVVIVGLAMIASADELIPEKPGDGATGVGEAIPSAKTASQPTPEGPTEDPIIQFLNGNEHVGAEPNSLKEPVKPAQPSKAPRKLPPRKPSVSSGIKAPKKPGSKPAESKAPAAPAAPAAPNAPSRLKAPSKPKKRF